jgi:transcriptional regulator with XRE-family HTH domain
MFGERLKAMRLSLGEGKGWSQMKLASAAGLALMTVNKLENNNADPNWSTVIKLARALGVSVAEFDDGTDPPTTTKGSAGSGRKRRA